MAPDDCLGCRARLPLSRTFHERIQASLDVRGVSALFLVPRSGCRDTSGRSVGTPPMSALRGQIGSRAASYLLSELRCQLRCERAAQLAIHFDQPNALANSLTERPQGIFGQSLISRSCARPRSRQALTFRLTFAPS